MKNKLLIVILIIIIIISAYKAYLQKAIPTFSLPTAKKVILLDPGHGGFDPGKLGTNGENEKDINLKISEKLQAYLEQSGSFVIATRSEDKALSDKKNQDLKERKNLANNSEADIMVSIHQNSFPKAKAKGAQVFYYNASKEGKYLAQCIQDKIKEVADPSNNRLIKPNTDYYVLRTTKIPSVIVECGFLSNLEEEQKLNTEEYQEKIAWSIYLGIVEYFENVDKGKMSEVVYYSY